VIAVSGLAWVLAVAALGHTDPLPRSVAVELRAGRPSLAVTLVVQPTSEAETLKSIADRDRDGRLDDAEAPRVERALTAEAARVVALTVDGVPLALEGTLEASFGVRGPLVTKAPVGVAARAEAKTLTLCGLHLVALEARAGGPGKTRVAWPDGHTEDLATGQRAERVVFLCERR